MTIKQAFLNILPYLFFFALGAGVVGGLNGRVASLDALSLVLGCAILFTIIERVTDK